MCPESWPAGNPFILFITSTKIIIFQPNSAKVQNYDIWFQKYADLNCNEVFDYGELWNTCILIIIILKNKFSFLDKKYLQVLVA